MILFQKVNFVFFFSSVAGTTYKPTQYLGEVPCFGEHLHLLTGLHSSRLPFPLQIAAVFLAMVYWVFKVWDG